MESRTLLVGTYGPRSTDALLALWRAPEAALCDLLELRLDHLTEADTRLTEVMSAAPRPVLATCRRASESGGFEGSEAARLDLLARAADLGAAWIDVEDDVPAPEGRRLAGRGAHFLRSRHAPRLPADAEGVVARLLEPPADAAKLVALGATTRETVDLLALLPARRGRLAAHVADIPFSRYAGASLGSLFTYASLRPGGRIPAPLPTVHTATLRRRFAQLRDGATPWVLLGSGVDRSASPDLLNVLLESLGAPVVALPWSVDDVAPAVEALRRFGWAGAAVTIPYKERVVALLDRIAPSAEEVGAVNTIVREGDALVGHNTDVFGIVRALADVAGAEELAGRTALVLGAGGAARAAVRAALGMGMRAVVYARRPDAAASLRSLRREGESEIEVARTEDEAVRAAPALVLHATPAETPFLDPALLPSRATILEMRVRRGPTALEAAAQGRHRVVRGLSMLLHQAAEQARLVAGRAPSAGALRAAREESLARLDRTIALVGLRCAGKSEVGPRLARLVGLPFLDGDAEVERRTGRPVERMLRDGEERRFRDVELQVLLGMSVHAPCVFATGGGAALHADALRRLAATAIVVLLDASDDVLLARWAATPRTPLTDLPPARELERQRAERMATYRSLADLVVDTSAISPDDAAEAIADAVDRGIRA